MRFTPVVNKTYTAEVMTWVTVHYRGGYSATVSLTADGRLLGEITSTNNSFVAGVVQAGETWSLVAKKEPGRGQLFTLATPLG